MTTPRLARRFVHLVLASVLATLASSLAANAQEQGATFEIVSTFDVGFIAGQAPSSLIQYTPHTGQNQDWLLVGME
jgi:hypothetical protein